MNGFLIMKIKIKLMKFVNKGHKMDIFINFQKKYKVKYKVKYR